MKSPEQTSKTLEDSNIGPETATEQAPAEPTTVEAPLSPERQLEQKVNELEQEQIEQIKRTEQLADEHAGIIDHLSSVVDEMSQDEDAVVTTAVEKQGFMDKIKNAVTALAHAQSNAEKELSQRYNKKLVKVLGAAGKVAGGMSGLSVGMVAGGGLFGGALAAIGGAKAGGYGLLKFFDRIADSLPESVQNKIKNNSESDVESESDTENSAEMVRRIEESAQENAELKEALQGKIDIINALPEEKRVQAWQKIAEHPVMQDMPQKIAKANSKYKEFWHNFEHKHPHAAMSLEFITHVSIPIATKGMLDPVTVEKIIMGLEYGLAGGVGEKISSVLAKESKALQQKLQSFIK